MNIFKSQKEVELEEKEASLVRIELSQYKAEKRLRIDEEMLADKEKAVQNKNICATAYLKDEAEFYKGRAERNSILAGLDEKINGKKDLLEIMESRDKKTIEMMKTLHTEAIKDKNSVIELLKAQVEILTAKLTEIKISDVHMHVDAKVSEAKK